MDGVRPLRIVSRGVRHGVEANGKIAWLPADMWPAAAEAMRRIDAMQERLDYMERLVDAAQAEADARFPVQTAVRLA